MTKKEIVDIKILPTEVEIRSDHPEFLHSTDFDQPQFLADQAQRHLDTHFRLIRHDFFGELKDALGGLVGLSRMPIFARTTKAQSEQHSSSVVCK
jgi:hypothetical protein